MPASNDAARACRVDLDALPSFLIDNDPGAPAHLERHGQAALDVALATARNAASQVANGADSLAVLRRYLAAWRRGHLGVGLSPAPSSRNQASNPNDAPTLTLLSANDLLWSLPSFHPSHRPRLEKLLAANQAALEARPRWVIDVRRNSGGSDDTYEPLLAWLMCNEWVTVGTEFLATPANVAPHERLCDWMGLDDLHSRALMQRLAASLRAAPRGTYVRLDEERDGFVWRQPAPKTLRRPKRVAVLIDHECGSSGEQFLLDLRQSRNVKLLGRPTGGVLDYSNVRPHLLPSGEHVLWCASSRSLRLPGYPIDGIGVAPDVFLPSPHNAAEWDAEILTAQRFLESGQ
jgi:hypothetical protein